MLKFKVHRPAFNKWKTDIKNGTRGRCVLGLVCLMAGKNTREESALCGSACRQGFVGVMIGVVDVKSLVEHNGEG